MAIPFSRIKSGKIPGFDYDIIYQSNNFGPFKIIEESDIPGYNKRAVKIKFINTGSEIITKFPQVMKGTVKDPYAPSVYGVACLGKGSCYDKGHNIWRNIINRCYNKNCQDYKNYGGIGVTVCDRWLCFEKFLEDLPYIDGYKLWVKNPNMYHLDKDLKQQNKKPSEKVYSLETCTFIMYMDNLVLSDYANKNKYIGVEHSSTNRYMVRPRINGVRYHIGTFENPYIAAAAYNNFINFMYGDNRIMLNNIEPVSPEEVMKYNLAPRQLYHLVPKE